MSYEGLLKVTGRIMIDIERAGKYRVTLCQFPLEADTPIVAKTARVKIAGIAQQARVEEDVNSVTFDMDLPAGETTLETFLTTAQGETGGAFFTYFELLQ